MTCIVTVFSFYCNEIFSQVGDRSGISFTNKELHQYEALTPFASTGIGSGYDVKYYRLWLRINPDTSAGAYIHGNLTLYFTTLQNDFSKIQLDFISNLGVDSARYHGLSIPPANIVEDIDTLNITIQNIASAGTLDSVTIYYKGVPQAAMWGTGYVRSTHGTPAQNYVYTLSESYSARNWWPCKLEVTDKADSLDLIISTPTAFKAAGNGTLFSEITDGVNRTTTWKSRYPIPAYLVCTAVANYVVYNSPNVTVGATSMPVYHYFFPETDNASVRTSVDGVNAMITAFNTWFGEYPYKNEKYGHYEFGFGGGMEHSTFSGMSAGALYSWSIIAHELGHQWYGDKITCGDWSNIWINESFAAFSELIAAEKVPALNGNLAGHRLSVKNAALARTIQTTYRPNTTSIATIFDPSEYIYDRGAMILNMLRLTLGDTKFFLGLQNYTADPLLAYKNAVTDDVKRHMENASGIDLADYFNDWIYNNGHATYNIQWGNNGTRIQFQAIQSRTVGSSAAYFDIPIPIRIQGALVGQDTTVIIFDNDGILNSANNGVLTSTGNNRINYNLSFVPTTITFDPNNLALATAAVSFNSALPIHLLELNVKKEIKNTLLNWKAVWTGEVETMEIQRSENGIQFMVIHKISANDISSGPAFHFNDANPLQGTSYYRIMLRLSNETISYSNIVKVQRLTQGGIHIVPNPANDYIYIDLLGSISDKVSIRIYDMLGRMKVNVPTANQVNKKMNIYVKDWAEGLYTVEVNKNGTVESKKILIKH